jgi:geranylgeranyl pyrophosphate synthase
MISARRKVVAQLLSTRWQHQLLVQQHRLKSSSASFSDLPIPESIRNAVKSSILDEANKSDSTFWSNQSANNNNNAVNGGHAANGGAINGGAAAVNGIHNSIHYSTTSGLEDPLDDWHLNSKPKYWPNLPPGVKAADPFQLTSSEIDSLARTIREDLLGTDHPVLNQAASYFFQADDSGGKKVRPMMVVLLSRALAEHVGATSVPEQIWSTPIAAWQRSDLAQSQRRLAEISEIIHTASLFHDDVIDEAETRRGKPAVHQVFGNKMAILAGDYLLARASISLARLRQVDVVECMSTIIEHLVRGEVMQMKGTSSTDESRLTYYLRKNYFKTASLMANSCRSAALLGNYAQELVDCSYAYGKHIGMAFQLVDDVLDFEGAAALMGKPALSDLNAGLATAPVLYALQQKSTIDTTLLQTMMDRKFRQDGDVNKAVELVFASDGIEKTKELAQVHAELAMDAALQLKPSEYRDALVHLAYKVVDRTR